ncbi:RNA-guided endonuclease IscB [Lactococcus allomyrinae]|uniref:HNH endonuclease n=1 Tax=Lactococcus allomyrinae TaxID=2419773 RepID=A0A387B7Z6_9LACT|nr:RNA-guided endonuclease IscB [Lactococcus allomyrinae]AYF99812.1 HNH endonuclease [Lactococcus allomyrinae]
MVRRWIKTGQAHWIGRDTIQFDRPIGSETQELTLGINAGYKIIGASVTSETQEYYASETNLRTDIVKNLSTKRQYRRSRRNHKTRYRQARFDNRVKSKHKGWLASSIEVKIDNHVQLIRKLIKKLPITNIIVEAGQFDIQNLKNPDITGKEYQEGNQLGFANVREYVLARDHHKCQHCKADGLKGIKLHVRHLVSRKVGGNRPDNLIILCENCHAAYHRGEFELKKAPKGYAPASAMSIMRSTLLDRLINEFGDKVETTFGYLVKEARLTIDLPKTSMTDAFVIAGNLMADRLDFQELRKHVRCHNRQLHKAKFLKGGIRKANQAPREVHGFRLFDKVQVENKNWFVFGRRTSGYFDLRSLTGEKLNKGSYSAKKIKLVHRANSVITQYATIAPTGA